MKRKRQILLQYLLSLPLAKTCERVSESAMVDASVREMGRKVCVEEKQIGKIIPTTTTTDRLAARLLGGEVA